MYEQKNNLESKEGIAFLSQHGYKSKVLINRVY